jgi:kynurenine formamidase
MKKLLMGASLALVLGAGSAFADECKPSKYGADDEIGAANLITPAGVAAAAKLVKKGESHPLGIVIDPSTPAFPPRGMMLQVVSPGQAGGNRLTQFGYEAVYNDDIAQLWFGIGPQIDGLGHLGEGGMYYNCNSDTEISQVTGLTKLGVHNIPPLVGRGVLINIAKHRGVDTLNAGDFIDSDELAAAAKAQGVTFEDAGIILVHTGWTDAKLKADPTAWVSGEPGLSNEAAVWLAGKNPIAVGADTWGVEAVPAKKGDKLFYGHVTLLKENGIYILETMNTGRLAKEGVTEFMFVLGQARIQGTVQMIINPVAMW